MCVCGNDAVEEKLKCRRKGERCRSLSLRNREDESSAQADAPDTKAVHEEGNKTDTDAGRPRDLVDGGNFELFSDYFRNIHDI